MNPPITRKAAVGFILLAAIVFLTAYYGNSQATPAISTGSIHTAHYRAPLISFPNPVETAAAITAVVELFTLVCYLVLKKLEPAINKAAEKSMRSMREQDQLKPEEAE
jgi:hypothetical protein